MARQKRPYPGKIQILSWSSQTLRQLIHKVSFLQVLANLRTPSAWVSSNNELGPCYGIIIVKDVFAGDASDIKAKLESGYIDHKVR